MAIWCINRAGAQDSDVELHFNFWRLPRRRLREKIRNLRWTANDFIEIGVMLNGPKAIQEVCIFLPFHIDKDAISDCGPYFENVDIAEGIFNEQMSVEIPAKAKGKFVSLKIDGDEFCRVHEFEESFDGISGDQLALEKIDHGTFMKIKTQAIVSSTDGIGDKEKLYFRLRFQMPDAKENPFLQPIRPADWALQSGFEQVELINFRMNEMRTLPDKIQHNLRSGNGQSIARVRLVAFLTAIPAVAEMTSSSAPSHKSRALEREIWDDYVEQGLPDDVAVYHWKKEPKFDEGERPINEFSAFVKLKQRRAGLGTVAIYLLFAFAFGVLGNLFASWVDAKFSLFSSFQHDATELEVPASDVDAGDAEEPK